MRFLFCAMSAAALITGCAAAKSTVVPTSGNPKIDALQQDIVDGKRDAAIAKIDKIETLSGQPLPVGNPSEFVDALKGCTVSGYGPVMKTSNHWLVHTEWNCPSGKIETFLATLEHHDKVTIADFKSN